MSDTDRVTTNGQTISRRMLAYLDASYVAAGLTPATHRVVTQGSWRGGQTSASGSTHDGGGAADLRVWNLPRGMATFSRSHPLVIELRRRGGAAWFRDQAHGRMDPHVHVILGPVGSEPGLSSGAAWQVAEYRAGRNGFSSGGSDYHDRPAQSAFVTGGTTTPPPTTSPALRMGDEMLFTVTLDGRTTFWICGGGSGRMVNVPSTHASTWTGARMTITDRPTWERMTRAWPQQS
jgi:hypothetical protein